MGARVVEGSVWELPDGRQLKVVSTQPRSVIGYTRHGSVGRFSSGYTVTIPRSVIAKSTKVEKAEPVKKAKATKKKPARRPVAKSVKRSAKKRAKR